jgi:glycosyltransferase involved in cell wall biosynthesis
MLRTEAARSPGRSEVGSTTLRQASRVPVAAFLSFRFGHTDGVSVVARRWMEAFAAFGFRVSTVAGEGEADRVVAGLAIDAVEPPDVAELTEALADADVVVVENLCTIPLNLPATYAAGKVLAGRPVVQHHHDPPWHRERFGHVLDLPLDDPAWCHVAITTFAAEELLARRGISAAVIPNGFPAPSPGDRSGQRRRLGVEEGELLVAHPVRAIERKQVPAAIALAEALGGTYWLLGPAEEGYGDELRRHLAAARCRVIHQPCTIEADIYAAADVVAFPSSWEGFGNPPIEAALHRRPAAVGHYRVADELRDLGFRFFEPQDADGIRAFLARPDAALLDENHRLAREHFSVERVRRDLAQLLHAAGWMP